MHCLFLYDEQLKKNTPLGLRPYPEVNAALFRTSAEKAIALMADANLVMKQILTSDSYSKNLMEAAQKSDQQEVERLVQSAGIKKKPKITYNPDGITMNFVDYVDEKECCHIITQLRWV
ncbi:hypothetical protein [Mesobacillus subterraneus]|uniref:Uncharacterized protein n=1 Tax=Mesobacillus subterraneus TaxID=285983 RepID=A0A3R9FGL9_9BACI|nr:hypothetical protein [Mesobacillus subterraneus]RSD27533.1 hypothetical protein EJA10_09195 [Mesobacillus subterraneus]